MTPLRTTFSLAAVACALAMARPAGAADALACPATFPLTSLHLSQQVDDGWTAGTGGPAPLVSLGLYSGPPSQGAALQPTTAHGNRVSWTLQPPFSQGVWLQCAYAGGVLTLQRPLQPIPKACVAQYGTAHAAKPRSIEFHCD